MSQPQPRRGGRGVAGSGRARLTAGPNVLSFDCGTTNLCYCLMEYLGPAPDRSGDGAAVVHREFNVVCWELFSLNSSSIKGAAEALVAELNRRPWMLDVDAVCIESQVVRNTEMKVLSHLIQMYFLTRSTHPREPTRLASVARERPYQGPQVSFIQAKSKFSVCEVPEPSVKTQRIRNKRVAISMAEKLLSDQGDLVTLRFFNSHSKRDDLADSMVQALYFLRLQESKKAQLRRVRGFLGQPVSDSEAPGVILSINEGCEEDKEIGLPHVYRSDSFVYPVLDLSSAPVQSSDKYTRTPLDPVY